ncbi:MAG: S8 family serine peptidase [Pseudomonadota bacterium]
MVRDQKHVIRMQQALPDIIATLGPIPDPPAYDGDEVRRELDDLLEMQASEEREARQDEIEEEIDDIIPVFLRIFDDASGAPVSLIRLMVLLQDAGLALASHYKEKFNRPRPHLMDHGIDPSITVPNHAAYPSGHATQAALIAHGMAEVFTYDPGVVAEAFDVAARIAENREWAGVHYASDGAAGAAIAQAAFTSLRDVYDEMFVNAIEDVQSYDKGPSPYLGNGPTGGRVPPKPPKNPLEQWSLARIGIGAGGAPLETGGSGVTVGLVDGAVDVTHPTFERGTDHAISAALAQTTDPTVWRDSPAAINQDYPVAKDGRMAFSSKGGGHGTAMGGLIVGTPAPDLCEIWGTAPEATLVPARVTTKMSDTHENRLAVAEAIIAMAFGPSACDVILVGPPFVRPADDAYPTNWSGPDDPEAAKTPCDPLALAIWLAALKVPVVIPAGNDGTSSISYPGAWEDFEAVVATLADGDGLKAVEAMLSSDALQPAKAWLGKSPQSGFGTGDDPFEGTGIIVVGSAKLDDPSDKSSDLGPARYSQSGPGLCFLCPSDRDEDPGAKPDPQAGLKFNYIPAPDILGHGGYAEEPASLASHQGANYGFGGTSAASAQATGVIARMIEARRRATQDVDGPSIRSAIATGLGASYSKTGGYGTLTVQAVMP